MTIKKKSSQPTRTNTKTPVAPRKGSHLVMILPDLHIPYQDKAALDCVMTAHSVLKPTRTVILGDWLDCQGFSDHPVKSFAEEKAHTYFEGEIKPCKQLLTNLEENTDEVIFIEGNHEFRVERTIVRMGGVMEDLVDLVSPRTLLSQDRSKPFTYIPYVPKGEDLLSSTYKIANDLRAIHGWTYSEHASAKHLQKAKTVSIVHGHTHRRQSHETRDPFTGRALVGWSPGALCMLQPLYQAANPTEWSHGFSLVWVTDDLERWTAYSPRIDRGVCILPDGRKVDGLKEKVT